MRLHPARLRQARFNAGMTQTMLATASGLTNGYISELERGKRNGSAPALRRIADVLDVKVSDLTYPNVTGDETPGDDDGGVNGISGVAACG